MVSFWPWKGDSSSTASFEKTLSALSGKITASQTRLDKFRTSSRRYKLLSTLYLVFGYLVYAIVLFLVVGYQHAGPWEWTGMAAGPIVIYLTRTVISFYYNLRIEAQSNQLKGYQEQRTTTIQKLKDATKYDSTLELLEKYGGEKANKDSKANADNIGQGDKKAQQRQVSGKQHQDVPKRLAFAPPPTANIQRPAQSKDQELQPSAEFAPNAESITSSGPPPRPAQNASQPVQPSHHPVAPPSHTHQLETHWYDRIFDVLLGEDETLPRNRIVLLCSHCKLVNGQAPPGTQSLADVGLWRCMGCGERNGEAGEDETKKIIREVLEEHADDVKGMDIPKIEIDEAEDIEAEVEREDEEVKAEPEVTEGHAAAVRKRHRKGTE